MATFGEKLEAAEFGTLALGLAALAYIIYAIWQEFQDPSSPTAQNLKVLGQTLGNVVDAITPSTAKVTTGNKFIGKPLTAGQAQGIVFQAFGSQQSYTLSPDMWQIWFPNTSYYDNHSGHVFDENNNDVGPLYADDGSANQPALDAVNATPLVGGGATGSYLVQPCCAAMCTVNQ